MRSSLRASRLVSLATLLLITTLIMLECSFSPVASTGGWGSETTNGAVIAGIVYDSAGIGVPDISVLLHKRTQFSQDSTTMVRKTSADSVGRYLFDSVAVGEYMVEALSSDSVQVAINGSVAVAQPTDTLTVSDTVKVRGMLTGTVVMKSPVPIVALIEKTPYRAAVASDGSYSFPVLPPGKHRVFAAIAAASSSGAGIVGFDTVVIESDKQITAAAIVPSVMPSDTAELIFDDFEDADFIHSYVQWWWQFNDSLNGGNSRAEGIGLNTLPGMPGAQGSNYALRIFYTLGTARGPGAFAGVGTRFGAVYPGIGSKILDVSAVKAIRFHARGTGRHPLSVQMISACGDSKSTLMRIDTLSSQWQEYRIVSSDLALQYDGVAAASWNERARSAMELLFVVTGAAQGATEELWIDNVIFER